MSTIIFQKPYKTYELSCSKFSLKTKLFLEESPEENQGGDTCPVCMQIS